MKLLLINPIVANRPGLAQNFRSRHPPLSLAILAALTPPDWEIAVQDENYEPASIVADADLVGITAFTSQITRAYKLADAYRAAGIPAVIGGVHAWARPDEALEHAGTVVIGEAESQWPVLCADAAAMDLWKKYFGERRTPFAVPERSILRPEYPVDSLQTARGCAEDCSFCSVHQFSGKEYRRQPLDLIEKDLANVKARHVFVVDDNFIGFSPAHARDAEAVLRVMRASGKEFIIQAPMSICQNRPLLDAAAAAGVRLIFIGLETGDEEGLELVSKRQNLKYGFDFDAIHKAGMGVIGSFVVGLDTDTPQKLRERATFMVGCGCDALQLTILTPLPGTRLFAQMLHFGRLLYTDFPRDWDRYDFTELTYLPKGFRSEAEFYDVMAEIVEEVWHKESIHAMARRTHDLIGNSAVTTWSQFLNLSYGDIMHAKAAIWTSRKEI